ncbi:hypothetical protein O8413_14315 [Vibrio furnissii]|uniref:hypothetical protein n=1 Tax=Vibrio furnissii TaxID=29494 RepID=UPI0024B99C77|nr:hypothetical protein [Vibrio furnissii]WHR51150.1 hypothetical protein O8413_14315 [Vibrio furnissii]
MKYALISAVVSLLLLTGCANEPRLGYYVAQLASEQTYNPNATQDNLDYIPVGTGERLEGVYKTYTGKGETLDSGTDSQFIGGFSNN